MLLRFIFSLIFILVVLPMVVHAESLEARRSCMATHMKDAIELNRERDSVYRRLSQGRSAIVTKKLISMEQRLLVLSPLVDLWAKPYQNAGLPIVCEDLIEMSHTPKMRYPNPEGQVPKNSYRTVLVDVVKTKLQEKLDDEDFAGMEWLADQYIQQLQRQPRFNCLVRHMLESIRRSAALAPRYDQAAKDRGLRSPIRLSKALLKAHLDILPESAHIDKLAAPLQADGIMIICQDVPHIPAI